MMRATWLLGLLLATCGLPVAEAGRIDGTVSDDRGRAIPARVSIRSATGAWFFPKSTGGTAVDYKKQRQVGSVEMHTTLSAHPFFVEVPPGEYTVTAERGKEFQRVVREVTVPETGGAKLDLKLPRWIQMSDRGWYSGDTHVHRSLEELPNVMLAEDLNVSLPLTYWVTQAGVPPARGNKTQNATKPTAETIAVDATHLIHPMNTEYEIFTVNGKRHTQGAVFILGHKTPFPQGVPPVAPLLDQIRREGAVLDVDKHNWPWSLMIIPVLKVDLFELANNHVWQTQFGFRQFNNALLPRYAELESDERGLTEWGWIESGFRVYYSLLNCGFRMNVTAGTASGVHPVPLGFGRVYVQVPGKLTVRNWLANLKAGHSFVTTGPMLFTTVNDKPLGSTIQLAEPSTVRVVGNAESAVPLDRLEIVVNGEVHTTSRPNNQPTKSAGFTSKYDLAIPIKTTSWIAVRTFEKREDKRVRFAHTNPIHVEVSGKPLRPRKVEVEYFVRRMQEEIARNKGVLSDEAVQEFRQALQVYQRISETARN